MNRVQLLSLSMLIITCSAAFAQEGQQPAGDVVQAPAVVVPAPAGNAPAVNAGWCSSIWGAIQGGAKKTKSALWTNRDKRLVAGATAGLAVLAWFLADRYTETGKKVTNQVKKTGKEFAESLKNNKKTQIITASTVAAVAALGAAEYYDYGTRAAYRKIFKKNAA